MCNSWTSLDYWQSIGHPEAWVGILTAAATFAIALATVLAVIVAAFMSYRYAKKQSIAQQNELIRQDKLKRKIKALEDVWGLLAYMSQQRSKYAVILWEKDKKKGGEKKYLFHFENFERLFMQKVSDIFYQQHAGLHLPEAIREQVFGYLHAAAFLYFPLKNQKSEREDGLFEIEKPEIAENLKTIYDQLNNDLKQELDKTYKALHSSF